jgi:CubicO group peptidase (beta-lactamase class C family)
VSPSRRGATAGGAGAGTLFFVDPGERIVAILLVQRLASGPAPEAIAMDFARLAYKA